MTIPLFTGNARRSLLIRRGRDSYGEEGRRGFSVEDSTQDDLEPLNSCTLREADATVGVLNFYSLWSQQEAEGSFPFVSCPLPPAFFDKINDSIGLNAVNLQPVLDEVFHVRG